jgi:enterobactin synthetase component D
MKSSLDSFLQVRHDPKTFMPATLLSSHFSSAEFTQKFFTQANIYCPANISSACHKRQCEYFVGRYLASIAMSKFQLRDVDLLSDQHRAPQWPKEVLGSISHSNDYATCLVGRRSDFKSIGIDTQTRLSSERADRLISRILDKTEIEILHATALDAALGLTLCFSAKESIYKALFPHIGKFFGFAAAKLVSIDNDKQEIHFQFDSSLSQCHQLPSLLRLQYHYNEQRVTTILSQR